MGKVDGSVETPAGSNSISIRKHLLFGLCSFFVLYSLVLILAAVLPGAGSFENKVSYYLAVIPNFVGIIGFARVIVSTLPFFQWWVVIPVSLFFAFALPAFTMVVVGAIYLSVTPYASNHLFSSGLLFLLQCVLYLSIHPWLAARLARAYVVSRKATQ